MTASAAVLGACSRSEHRTSDTAALTSAPVPTGAARTGDIPRRALGRTGATVSILGVGGSHLGEAGSADAAARIVHEAIDSGVDFFDNAWEYHDGRSEDWLGKALAGRRDKVFLMTKVCTHGRDKTVALQQLEESLRRLGTDHLDLWQVHECIYANDPALHYAAGGVLEALTQAKKDGKVRFVGFTGHKDPKIHLEMLTRGFAFDTVQMPLGVFDATFRSFQKQVLPEVNRRGMGAIAMKSLGGIGEPVLRGAVTPDEAIRYTMSLPVATVVTGIDSLSVLRQNVAIARGFVPMEEQARTELEARTAPFAADGRFELYKTTLRFDAKVGREQHDFPTTDEVPI